MSAVFVHQRFSMCENGGMLGLFALVAPYWDGLWKHWRKTVIGSFFFTGVGILQFIANFTKTLPASLSEAIHHWGPPTWAYFVVALIFLVYAQFRMWADEHHGRESDKISADRSLEVKSIELDTKRIELDSKERDWNSDRANLIEHQRLELEAKERDWSNERIALLDEITKYRSKSPNIFLQYEGVAQLGRFSLCNTGDVDATNVQISNIVLNKKFLRFRTVSRIQIAGESISPELSMHWVPQKPEDHDGAFYFGPVSPDRGKHRAALEWLIEDNCPGLQPNDIFHSEVAVTFDNHNGDPCGPRYFQISFNLASKRIEVFLMRLPDVVGQPIQQSPESTRHEN